MQYRQPNTGGPESVDAMRLRTTQTHRYSCIEGLALTVLRGARRAELDLRTPPVERCKRTLSIDLRSQQQLSPAPRMTRAPAKTQ